MEIDQIIDDYTKKLTLYKRFTEKNKQLLEEILDANNIKYILEARTKDPEHLREKILREGKSYDDPLYEITDFSGLRIILHNLTDVDKVVHLIQQEFIIDERNSIYKGYDFPEDQFGYRSIHLIACHKEERIRLIDWKDFENLKAEIQIRTHLQHAWAETSHEFDYKLKADVPKEIRRRLFRLSALFELADEEFDKIVHEVNDLLGTYKEKLIRGEKLMEINVDSLKSYIENSGEIQYWNDFIRSDNEIGHEVQLWGDLSRDIRIAEFCGLKTIEDIDQILRNARGWGEIFFREFFKIYYSTHDTTPDKVHTVINGSLTMLMIASYAEKFEPEILIKEFGFGTPFILETAKAARKHKS